jgi:tRNA-binding protein
MTPFEHFQSITMKVGTVIDAQEFPEARNPSFKLWIDFGDNDIKKTSAQITKNYNPQELIGQQVVALVDISPRQIGPFMSECLLLGAANQNDDIVILQPNQIVPNGKQVH